MRDWKTKYKLTYNKVNSEYIIYAGRRVTKCFAGRNELIFFLSGNSILMHFVIRADINAHQSRIIMLIAVTMIRFVE